MRAPLTIGEHRSPIIAALLTMPLNPCEYSFLIIWGDQARTYAHKQIKRSTVIRKELKLNKADILDSVYGEIDLSKLKK